MAKTTSAANPSTPLSEGADVAFDLNRIIPFVAVAEELSFSRAAKRLAVDHTWLSRQISQLEKQLGFALFFRNTRNVQLSPQGESFLAHAQEIVNAAVRAGEIARQLARRHDATFTFGVMPFTYWVPARNWIIGQLESRAPDATINIVPKVPDALIEDVVNGVVDAAIIDGSRNIPSQLHSHTIHKSLPGLLVPADDDLAGKSVIRPGDLKGRRIAVNDPSLWPGHNAFYASMKAAGAIPVVVPEGRRAMAFYARRQGLIFVTFSWPYGELGNKGDFVYKQLNPPLDVMEYVVVARPENASPLGRIFWNLVTSVDPDQPDALAGGHRAFP